MSKLRLIQCGVGGFGKGWLQNHTTQSEDFDLAAIVDLSQDNLAAGIEIANLPEEKAFSTLEEALGAVEADVVLTVTPPVEHAQHARLAFAKGLHVMTEKPLADTIPNGKEMIALAKQAGKQLAVSQNYRFNATIQKLKKHDCPKGSGRSGSCAHGLLHSSGFHRDLP